MATFGGKEGERMINSRNRRQIRAVMEPKEKTINNVRYTKVKEGNNQKKIPWQLQGGVQWTSIQ